MSLDCLWTFSFPNNHSVARALGIVYTLTRNTQHSSVLAALLISYGLNYTTLKLT